MIHRPGCSNRCNSSLRESVCSAASADAGAWACRKLAGPTMVGSQAFKLLSVFSVHRGSFDPSPRCSIVCSSSHQGPPARWAAQCRLQQHEVQADAGSGRAARTRVVLELLLVHVDDVGAHAVQEVLQWGASVVIMLWALAQRRWRTPAPAAAAQSVTSPAVCHVPRSLSRPPPASARPAAGCASSSSACPPATRRPPGPGGWWARPG